MTCASLNNRDTRLSSKQYTEYKPADSPHEERIGRGSKSGRGIEWPRDVAAARAIQQALRSLVVTRNRHGRIRTVAGVDIGFEGGGRTTWAVLRTRSHAYISIGHRVSLKSAITCTPGYTTRYRLPETTRRAHRLAAGL